MTQTEASPHCIAAGGKYEYQTDIFILDQYIDRFVKHKAHDLFLNFSLFRPLINCLLIIVVIDNYYQCRKSEQSWGGQYAAAATYPLLETIQRPVSGHLINQSPIINI